ncbi:MAG: hypothetical protein K0S08_1173 [Gammaproteobacteria bacterium]|jgi:hypothetical protein|nr:hypothetical protein [Gammaproteobacteria bacterium]
MFLSKKLVALIVGVVMSVWVSSGAAQQVTCFNITEYECPCSNLKALPTEYNQYLACINECETCVHQECGLHPSAACRKMCTTPVASQNVMESNGGVAHYLSGICFSNS